MKFKNGRFAPSPTGLLHIGGLRTCLANAILAKNWHWRIEDTDTERQTEGSVGDLVSNLSSIFNKTFIHCQSHRRYFYLKFCKSLQEFVYESYDTPEELERKRDGNPGFKYKKAEQASSLQARDGVPGTTRIDSDAVLKLLQDKDDNFACEVLRHNMNNVLKKDQIDDFVLIKSNGMPSYFLASVFDDTAEDVDLVIRGEEWLGTFGNVWMLMSLTRDIRNIKDKINYLHLPLILNPDKSKMSKRNTQVESTISGLKKQGYLTEAILNYCYQLLVPASTDKLSLDEMMKQTISLDDIVSKPVCFDPAILDRYQKMWLRVNIKRISNLTQIKESLNNYDLDTTKLTAAKLEALTTCVLDKMPQIKTQDQIVSVLKDSMDPQNFKADISDSLNDEDKTWLKEFWFSYQNDTSRDPLDLIELVNLKTGSNFSKTDCLKLLQTFLMGAKSTFRVNIISQYLSDDDLKERFEVLFANNV